MLTLRDLAALAAANPEGLEAAVEPLRIGDRVFDSSARPVVMGCVNLSRDSTYRESIATSTESALRKARVMAAQGADLVDIGGTMVRAALPSHVCVDQGLLFEDGDKCVVNLAAVTWFDGEIVVESKVNK